MNCYTYDTDGVYISAEECQLDPLETEALGYEVFLLPANATFIAPPEDLDKKVPVWNGASWEIKEDHRRKRDSSGMIIETSGTPFWLPEDTYESPARYMEEIGDLPECAILERPEKSAAVLLQEKISEIDSQLVELDNKYLTQRILVGIALKNSYALEQWNKHEEEAEPIRTKRSVLVSQLSELISY